MRNVTNADLSTADILRNNAFGSGQMDRSEFLLWAQARGAIGQKLAEGLFDRRAGPDQLLSQNQFAQIERDVEAEVDRIVQIAGQALTRDEFKDYMQYRNTQSATPLTRAQVNNAVDIEYDQKAAMYGEEPQMYAGDAARTATNMLARTSQRLNGSYDFKQNQFANVPAWRNGLSQGNDRGLISPDEFAAEALAHMQDRRTVALTQDNIGNGRISREDMIALQNYINTTMSRAFAADSAFNDNYDDTYSSQDNSGFGALVNPRNAYGLGQGYSYQQALSGISSFGAQDLNRFPPQGNTLGTLNSF